MGQGVELGRSSGDPVPFMPNTLRFGQDQECASILGRFAETIFTCLVYTAPMILLPVGKTRSIDHGRLRPWAFHP